MCMLILKLRAINLSLIVKQFEKNVVNCLYVFIAEIFSYYKNIYVKNEISSNGWVTTTRVFNL